MLQSDSARGECPAVLIRDIGKSSTITPQTNAHEQQLMRVARDPLAIRELLLQAGVSPEEAEAVTLLRGEAVIALARCILIEGNAGRINWRQGDMHYLRQEAHWQAAAEASAFAPTSEDREEALDLNLDGGGRCGAPGSALLRLTAFCALAVLLVVTLQLIVS